MPRLFRSKSIFVTIYGGILLVVLSVSLVAYFSLSYVNKHRAKTYTQEVATAMFHIAAVSIARQPEEMRDIWLSDASILVGAPMRLQPSLPFEPSGEDIARLNEGRAVVRRQRLNSFSDIWIRVPLPGKTLYLATQLEGFGEQQVRAAATFFLEDLAYYPGQEALRLQTLSPFIGFPMKLMPMFSAGLDSEQIRRLNQDEIIVRLTESAIAGRNQLTVFAPSQLREGELLVVGPVALFDRLPVGLMIMTSVIALLLITLGAYGVIHLFERRLAGLTKTVMKLQSGDLNARMTLDGEDEISRLGDTVNQMAGHIQRLLDVQRELTQAVSHELRTPLARLRFGMEMLAETEDIDDRYAQLDQLDEDVSQLNTLIDEILTYASLEQGSPQLNFEEVDIDELLARIERETKALNKPVKLRLEMDSGLVVDAVPRYLHRVIQNLVGNAMRYANKEVLLRFEVRQGTAFLTVEDDGPGIPEEDWKRVFEPFTRLDDSRTRSTGGYGLGLSIVNRIAYWFGGTIRVGRSVALGGASFIMRWPAKRVMV
ncbi:MAG: ATP-binding protein [Moraxellaceae bacterium]|nr:ATP-binding protein [Moraxellaceae bacterium]MDP1776974.1 ATP-binding protein [Moraxellaceae bacterium]MDZ4297286.1 ATP-binding protein [Moraxellaceae bacterium]MDZ4387839.1 ATP-binding protein [Moraxellaceae bacterium]